MNGDGSLLCQSPDRSDMPPDSSRMTLTNQEEGQASAMRAEDQECATVPPPRNQDEADMGKLATWLVQRKKKMMMILTGKTRFLCFLLCFVILITFAIAAALVVARLLQKGGTQKEPNPSQIWDSQQRSDELRPAVIEASGSAAFLDPNSPQSKALEWLEFQDTCLKSPSDPNLLQRYALLVFAYATNGQFWRGIQPWFDLYDQHECTFQGVTCNSQLQVTTIELSLRKLTGTLPEEIGLLTELTSFHASQNSLEGTMPQAIFEKLIKLGKLPTNYIGFCLSLI